MEKIWLKFYSEGIPSSANYLRAPLHHLLFSAAEKYSAKPALIFFGKKMTYGELASASSRFASALRGLGVGKGHCVALMFPNSPQAVVSYFGALMAGALITQLNPLLTDREIAFQLTDSGATTVVVLDVLLDRVAALVGNCSVKNLIIAKIDDDLPFHLSLLRKVKGAVTSRRPSPGQGVNVFHFEELMRSAGADAPRIDIDPDVDCALYQYTGGTTGMPKAAMLTHRNLLANSCQTRFWFPKAEEGREVWLSVLPFFHVFGLTVCLNFPLSMGAAIVLMPRFAVKEVLGAVEKYKVTILPGVPSMFSAMVNYKRASSADLKSIKFCISGAAPLPENLINKFEAITAGILVEGYGLTEASPVTHCNPLYGLRKAGSIGLPLPDTDCKVVDLDDCSVELPPNEKGQICIKGPQVMMGYLNRPDETAKTLRDGWLYTGDIGSYDEDGYFYVTDRLKDMIIIGGYKVYPRDVEEVLYKHPKVEEAAVLGILDRRKGEIIKAYVALKKGQNASCEELLDHCRASLASYKVPKYVEFREELPKSPMGKILKRSLQAGS